MTNENFQGQVCNHAPTVFPRKKLFSLTRSSSTAGGKILVVHSTLRTSSAHNKRGLPPVITRVDSYNPTGNSHFFRPSGEYNFATVVRSIAPSSIFIGYGLSPGTEEVRLRAVRKWKEVAIWLLFRWLNFVGGWVTSCSFICVESWFKSTCYLF